MAERRRWDIDERFVGVADAATASADVERLLEMTRTAGWITEDALAHLGSSCTAAAEMLGVEIARMEVVDDILEVDLRQPPSDEARAPRIVAYGVVGSFAEAATHVRETREQGAVVLDVVTGMLPGDGAFATHGHLVRLRLLGA